MEGMFGVRLSYRDSDEEYIGSGMSVWRESK